MNIVAQLTNDLDPHLKIICTAFGNEFRISCSLLPPWTCQRNALAGCSCRSLLFLIAPNQCQWMEDDCSFTNCFNISMYGSSVCSGHDTLTIQTIMFVMNCRRPLCYTLPSRSFYEERTIHPFWAWSCHSLPRWSRMWPKRYAFTVSIGLNRLWLQGGKVRQTTKPNRATVLNKSPSASPTVVASSSSASCRPH